MSELLQFPVKTDFNPEQTRVMGEAFDVVCVYLKHGGPAGFDTAEVREQAAHRIIEEVAGGEVDPTKLADHAITRLRSDRA